MEARTQQPPARARERSPIQRHSPSFVDRGDCDHWPMSKAMVTIRSVFAQLECDKLVERTGPDWRVRLPARAGSAGPPGFTPESDRVWQAGQYRAARLTPARDRPTAGRQHSHQLPLPRLAGPRNGRVAVLMGKRVVRFACRLSAIRSSRIARPRPALCKGG